MGTASKKSPGSLKEIYGVGGTDGNGAVKFNFRGLIQRGGEDFVEGGGGGKREKERINSSQRLGRR